MKKLEKREDRHRLSALITPQNFKCVPTNLTGTTGANPIAHNISPSDFILVFY